MIRTKDTAWSSRSRLAWRLIGDLALFAVYMRSFQAQEAVTFSVVPIADDRRLQQ